MGRLDELEARYGVGDSETASAPTAQPSRLDDMEQRYGLAAQEPKPSVSAPPSLPKLQPGTQPLTAEQKAKIERTTKAGLIDENRFKWGDVAKDLGDSAMAGFSDEAWMGAPARVNDALGIDSPEARQERMNRNELGATIGRTAGMATDLVAGPAKWIGDAVSVGGKAVAKLAGREGAGILGQKVIPKVLPYAETAVSAAGYGAGKAAVAGKPWQNIVEDAQDYGTGGLLLHGGVKAVGAAAEPVGKFLENRRDARAMAKVTRGADEAALDPLGGKAGLDRMMKSDEELAKAVRKGPAAVAELATGRSSNLARQLAAGDSEAAPVSSQAILDSIDGQIGILKENPASASQVRRLETLKKDIRKQWGPDLAKEVDAPAPIEAPKMEGPALLQTLAAKAGPKARARIANRRDDVLRLADEYPDLKATAADPEANTKATAAALDTVGKKIGDIRDRLDKHAGDVPVGRLTESAADLAKQLEADPLTHGRGRQALDFAKQIEGAWGNGTVSPTQARSLISRTRSEGYAGMAGQPPTPEQLFKRQLADSMEKALDEHVDAALAKGPDAKTAARRALDSRKELLREVADVEQAGGPEQLAKRKAAERKAAKDAIASTLKDREQLRKDVEGLKQLHRDYSVLKDLDVAARRRAADSALTAPKPPKLAAPPPEPEAPAKPGVARVESAREMARTMDNRPAAKAVDDVLDAHVARTWRDPSGLRSQRETADALAAVAKKATEAPAPAVTGRLPTRIIKHAVRGTDSVATRALAKLAEMARTNKYTFSELTAFAEKAALPADVTGGLIKRFASDRNERSSMEWNTQGDWERERERLWEQMH